MLTLKYGPTKTCCWSPTFAALDAADLPRALAARASCPLPAEPNGPTRLVDGMMTLGSFIGTDAFVSNSALEKVDDCSVDANGLLIDPTSIHNTCTALVQLADSACA